MTNLTPIVRELSDLSIESMHWFLRKQNCMMYAMTTQHVRCTLVSNEPLWSV